jgi:hypothetical protein
MNRRATKYFGDGSVMIGTKHRNNATAITNTGMNRGTCKGKTDVCSAHRKF